MGFLKRLFSSYPIAPVISDPKKIEPDKPYRRRDDPESIIRMRQSRPKGFNKRASAYWVAVAGISERTSVAESFFCGANQRITLARDPKNEYDENAIKVLGAWDDSSGSPQQDQLGWIPKDAAKEIAKDYPDKPLIGTIEVIFLPSEGKSGGIRINVWTIRKTGKPS